MLFWFSDDISDGNLGKAYSVQDSQKRHQKRLFETFQQF